MTPPRTREYLTDHLHRTRDALLWKLDGLDERAARWPWTPTGTNLLGTVKHAAGVELAYFGECFGRDWPGEPLWWMAEDAEDNADMWATGDESVAGIVDLYRRVWAFADETITGHDLDAEVSVPWWPAERRQATLGQLIAHVTSDLDRHVGHCDILRELTDGRVGMRPDALNMPPLDARQWAEHVDRLKAIAQAAGSGVWGAPRRGE